ncbi:OBAP family protein [Dyadobacter sp. CY345]|uniref:OBAP family protein n=1 Tax=Dyadobacter sp. CY345 TaxID=2909335 RepID=UPI001F32719D|nr:OBAP family protein [Dyadobacter sp. CY345]MCF2446722.1 OBAP family protein [Dyadobacter sp. CY345]
MKKNISFYLLIPIVIFFSCGERNTSSNVEAPGDSKTGKDKLLTTGADLLQSKNPLKKFSTYLDGFHFYNGNINAQMEAHHYVSQLNEDLYQAIIFDGNKDDAKIMGIEYIITSKLFATLSQEEKLLWHSHSFEVSSGSLIAPGIPEIAEHELMEKLISTYGKTIHTWHTDQQRTLPIGAPMIMMGFTKDGQLHSELLNDRDKRFNISTQKKKENRIDIPVPKPASDADAWQKGQIRQFVISHKADSAIHKH